MNILWVFIGGFFGAICRFLMGEWIHTDNSFPLATFIINVIGCFFLAWLLTYATNRMKREFILLMGTGFTGAFTTFSTFSVETVRLVEKNQFMTGFMYPFLSVGCGLLLSFLGYKLAVAMKEKKEVVS